MKHRLTAGSVRQPTELGLAEGFSASTAEPIAAALISSEDL